MLRRALAQVRRRLGGTRSPADAGIGIGGGDGDIRDAEPKAARSMSTIVDIDAVVAALRRIATVVDGSENHDYVIGRAAARPDLLELVEERSGLIPSGVARDHLLAHGANAKCRWYALDQGPAAPGAEAGASRVLGYGYTANNRREFAFLTDRLTACGSDLTVVNVCDLEPRYRRGAEPRVLRLFADALDRFLADRDGVTPGMLHQLRVFVTSLQGAIESLQGAQARPGAAFAVANDHSPAPVAWAAVAAARGLRTIYVQHAEVSGIFPPLDFTLSLLRNRRSAEVYAQIAPARGGAVIAARRDGADWQSPDELVAERRRLAATPRVDVVVYPSSVFEPEQLGALLAELGSNPEVDRVSVKPHPNSRIDIEGAIAGQADVIDAVPARAHIAICGNSSIVVELLEHGSLVFHDFHLDRIRRDYYGFVAAELADELPHQLADGRWWEHARNFGPQQLDTLAEYVPRLATTQNLVDALAIRPELLAAVAPGGRDDPDARRAVDEAGHLREIVEQPHAALADARAGRGRYADPDVAIGALAAADDVAASGCAAVVGPLVDRCESVLDLWLLLHSRRHGGRSLSPDLVASAAEWAARHETSLEVVAWAAELRRRQAGESERSAS